MNSLIYRTLFYVNMCGSYKLSKTVRFWPTLYIIGPPVILVRGLTFYRDSIFFLSSFFFRPLPSELAERNSTTTGRMLGNDCDLKTHVQNVGSLLQIGCQNHLFRRLCNLTATLTVYIFRTKHGIDNRTLATRMGLLHRLKTR